MSLDWRLDPKVTVTGPRNGRMPSVFVRRRRLVLRLTIGSPSGGVRVAVIQQDCLSPGDMTRRVGGGGGGGVDDEWRTATAAED